MDSINPWLHGVESGLRVPNISIGMKESYSDSIGGRFTLSYVVGLAKELKVNKLWLQDHQCR